MAKYNTEQPVEAKYDDTSAFGGWHYSHPSHGMISVHHWTGGSGKQHFGSEIETQGGVRIEISRCETRNDLGRNWYHSKETIAEVSMSAVQYAEMISHPNSSGVPCTITYTEKDGYIKYAPIEDKTTHIEKELNMQVNELKQNVATLVKDVSTILDQKSPLKKSDKDAIKSLVSKLNRAINSSIPFYEKCIDETIERKKMEAQVEVNSMITHAINRVGLAAMNNPEVMQKLLSDDSGE